MNTMISQETVQGTTILTAWLQVAEQNVTEMDMEDFARVLDNPPELVLYKDKKVHRKMFNICRYWPMVEGYWAKLGTQNHKYHDEFGTEVWSVRNLEAVDIITKEYQLSTDEYCIVGGSVVLLTSFTQATDKEEDTEKDTEEPNTPEEQEVVDKSELYGHIYNAIRVSSSQGKVTKKALSKLGNFGEVKESLRLHSTCEEVPKFRKWMYLVEWVNAGNLV